MDAESLRATAASLAKLQQASEYPVRVCWYCNSAHARNMLPIGGYEHWANATEQDIIAMVGDDDLVMVLLPGDEVRPEVHMALKFHGSFDADLTLLDLCIRDGGRIFPFLLHAVDPVHARYCDYFLGRYVANGRTFKRNLVLSPSATLPKIGRAICSQLDAYRAHRHIALPLICINMKLSELQTMRSPLILSEPDSSSAFSGGGPAPASGVDRGQISAVICSKDCGMLLRQLLHRLKGEPLIADIIIVSNNTTNTHAIRNLQDAAKLEQVTVLRYDGSFNFSRQCNLGARYAKGTKLLFINDDIVPVSEHWLEQLHEWMDEPRIVGPLLVYPDQSVQHAGMHLGFKGLAGHVLRHAHVPAGDYGFFLTAPRHVSCLTGACMLMPRAIYSALNGFDPMLATYLQDVDLSLRALYSGYNLILDPRAILIHMESVSVNPTFQNTAVRRTQALELNYFKGRWEKALTHDAWMNPLFDPIDDESLESLRI
jgi:GT2 family glycosyltransferase